MYLVRTLVLHSPAGTLAAEFIDKLSEAQLPSIDPRLEGHDT